MVFANFKMTASHQLLLRASDEVVAFIAAKGPRGTAAAARAKKPEEVEKEATLAPAPAKRKERNVEQPAMPTPASAEVQTHTHVPVLMDAQLSGVDCQTACSTSSQPPYSVFVCVVFFLTVPVA